MTRSLVCRVGTVMALQLATSAALAADAPKGPDQAWWDDNAPERAWAAEYHGVERKAY